MYTKKFTLSRKTIQYSLCKFLSNLPAFDAVYIWWELAGLWPFPRLGMLLKKSLRSLKRILTHSGDYWLTEQELLEKWLSYWSDLRSTYYFLQWHSMYSQLFLYVDLSSESKGWHWRWWSTIEKDMPSHWLAENTKMINIFQYTLE